MRELDTLEALTGHLEASTSLSGCALLSLNLQSAEPTSSLWKSLASAEVEGTLLLGCEVPSELSADLERRGACLFPDIKGLPFECHRAQLYGADELFAGFDPDRPESYEKCRDGLIYQHWKDSGGAHPKSIREGLARRLHDHAITDALDEWLGTDPQASAETQPRQVVAVMGGHSVSRDSESYGRVAQLARRLSQQGYCMATGGGPGAMEATHVGAWFAERSEQELQTAIQKLSAAPMYTDREWLSMAFRVRQEFPLLSDAHPSLGVPTWLYGHEPPTPFATTIAKYFANSVREDGLVTLASHGIVFSPGSAGTVQEIFQDATQNHYVTTGVISPMVLLGRDYWTEKLPVVSLLKQLSADRPYANSIAVLDEVDEVIDYLASHPPFRPSAS